MTTNQSRKRRGAQTQAIVAEWFRTHGWPFAESAGAGRQGADLTGTVDIAVEVKARRDFAPAEWLRQASSNSGGRLPFVVIRPDGSGPATIESWPVVVRLDKFTALLREAGYGDGEGVPF